jgi:hypothetical protein
VVSYYKPVLEGRPMQITLTLAPDKLTALQQRATASGTDLAGFILDAVEEKLEEPNGPVTQLVPYEQWREEFRSWITSHRSRNPQVDDSRESIYS